MKGKLGKKLCFKIKTTNGDIFYVDEIRCQPMKVSIKKNSVIKTKFVGPVVSSHEYSLKLGSEVAGWNTSPQPFSSTT